MIYIIFNNLELGICKFKKMNLQMNFNRIISNIHKDYNI